jgi:branched-chain amino acid transport system substrate-binding protein
LAQSKKIPFVTPFATHPDVTLNKEFVFRTCFDDDYQASKLAEFIVNDLKKKKILLLINKTNAYSLGMQKIFTEQAKTLGADIRSVLGFGSHKDFDQKKLEEIKALGVEVVLLPSYQVEAAAILSELINVLPKNTVFVGPDSWGGGRLFHKVFQDRDPSFEGYYVQHISEERRLRASKLFQDALKLSGLNSSPLFQGTSSMTSPVAIGYDTGRVIFEALKLKSKNKKLSLKDAISQVSFEGITGPISFGGNRTPKKPLYIYAINNKGESFLKEFK